MGSVCAAVATGLDEFRKRDSNRLSTCFGSIDLVANHIPDIQNWQETEHESHQTTDTRCLWYAFSDQIALVSVPLVAALIFDAPAEVIGVLVACQSMAHLLGSIPFGILIDTHQQRSLMIGATILSLIGFGGAAVSIGLGNLFWFGLFVVLSGFGIALFMLTTFSIIPKVVEKKDFGIANASIELPRTLASFAVPLSIGIAVSYVSVGWLFPLAAACAAVAFIFTLRLPAVKSTPKIATSGVFHRIIEGGEYVVGHSLLRAILLCAIFWNFAFSALLRSSAV